MGKGCRAAAVNEKGGEPSMHDEKMVDPLAMVLFGVVRDLPADERRALLGMIDGQLRGMCGESAHLAEQVVRQGGESQRRTASKCRDRPRPGGASEARRPVVLDDVRCEQLGRIARTRGGNLHFRGGIGG
ncbi:MAG: hypothetical protein WBZ37_26870 [Mycobacterium sp.]